MDTCINDNIYANMIAEVAATEAKLNMVAEIQEKHGEKIDSLKDAVNHLDSGQRKANELQQKTNEILENMSKSIDNSIVDHEKRISSIEESKRYSVAFIAGISCTITFLIAFIAAVAKIGWTKLVMLLA